MQQRLAFQKLGMARVFSGDEVGKGHGSFEVALFDEFVEQWQIDLDFGRIGRKLPLAGSVRCSQFKAASRAEIFVGAATAVAFSAGEQRFGNPDESLLDQAGTGDKARGFFVNDYAVG